MKKRNLPFAIFRFKGDMQPIGIRTKLIRKWFSGNKVIVLKYFPSRKTMDRSLLGLEQQYGLMKNINLASNFKLV